MARGNQTVKHTTMKTALHFLAAGLLSAAVNNALGATHYVDLNSPTPAPPYTNWASAARVIQDAVDAAGLSQQTTFTQVSNGAIVNDLGTITGAVWGDFNNDGCFGLFVSNWGSRANVPHGVQ